MLQPSIGLPAALLALAGVFTLASQTAAKEVVVSIRAKQGGDEAQVESRRKAVQKVVMEVLLEEGLTGKIAGPAREALLEECLSLVTKESFKERRGKWRYSARIDTDRVREKAVARHTGPTAARQLCAAIELEGAEPQQLADFRAGLAQRLAKSGHRLLDEPPAKAPPKALTLKLRVEVFLRAYPESSARGRIYLGQLGLKSSRLHIADPSRGWVVARGPIRSDKRRNVYRESGPELVAEPLVNKQADLATAERAYLEHLAEWVGGLLARRIALATPPISPVVVRLEGLSRDEAKDLRKVLSADKRVIKIDLVSRKETGLVVIAHDLEAVLREALDLVGFDGELEQQPKLVIRKKK